MRLAVVEVGGRTEQKVKKLKCKGEEGIPLPTFRSIISDLVIVHRTTFDR